MTDAKRDRSEPVHTTTADAEVPSAQDDDDDTPLHDFGDPCFMILNNAIYNLSLGARPAPINTNTELPYVVWKLGSDPTHEKNLEPNPWFELLCRIGISHQSFIISH